MRLFRCSKTPESMITFSDDFVERTAKLFEAGEYPDKGINVSEDDIGKTVTSFTDPVDIKIEHINTPLDGSMGQVSTIFRHGKELYGKVRFPERVWGLIRDAGATKLSVGLDRSTMALREVSLTNKPRVAGAAIFSVTDDTLGVVGEIFADQRDSDVPAEESEETGASGQNVSDLLKLLTEVLDFTLPVDTTGENFVERAVTALTAIRGKEEEAPEDDGTIKEPAKNSKEQPGPVAMSKELEFAISLLDESGIKNPTTGKPYTEDEVAHLSQKDDEPETIKMSEADQATVNWARKRALSSYRDRIEMCVKQGRVPAKDANELWNGLQEQATAGTFTFAFDGDGEPQKTQYDFVIEAWEKVPANMALTGLAPTAAAQKQQLLGGAAAFSLTSGAVTQEAPDFTEPSSVDAPVSDEEVDNILSVQWGNSGKRQNDIEGGFGQNQTSRMAGTPE